MTGFRMTEIMRGRHRLEGAAAQAEMDLRLSWGHPQLRAYLNPLHPDFLCARARGTITAGGLVRRAVCTGSLKLLYFCGRRIRYRLEFADAAGRKYLYHGEKKDIRPWNLHRSHTTCHGIIAAAQDGRVVSRSMLRFELHQLAPFLRSLRLPASDDASWMLFPPIEAPAAEPAAVLSARERKILIAVAGGLIPGGGSFKWGAAELAPQWLGRSEFALQRMPVPTSFFFRFMLHLLDRLLPLFFAGSLRPLTALPESRRSRLMAQLEAAGFLGHLALMMMKVLVLPAFYGLPQVKAAVGYSEKFENPSFERLKA